MERFTGLIAAAHSPMDADGALDLDAVERQAEHFASTGVSGVFVGGTTGECHSLGVDERIDLARRWCEVAPDHGLRVIVHVGHNALPDAQGLAARAEGYGAEAVAAMAPIFFRPGSIAELVDFLAEIAAAAPTIPFYYYDIPLLTGVDFPTPEMLRKGKERIPNLAGVKYTKDDLQQYRDCVKLDDGAFDVLFGTDERLVEGLARGARGAVGSTYNFAAPLYRRILRAYDAGDLETARDEQARSLAMVERIATYGYVAAAKAVMGLIGVDCGKPRLPLRALSPDEIEALRSDLDEIGFFEWSRLDANP